MKVITTPSVREEAKYFCDKHKTIECFTEMRMQSGYGSSYDTERITWQMCDECVKEVRQFLTERFGQVDIELVL
jgi:hypothetical protein